MATPAAPRRKLLALAAFWAWVPAVVLPGVYLMAGHLLTLPHPSAVDPELARAVLAARGPEERGAWTALHVLSGECPCSRRILDHLVERGAIPGVFEKILLVEGGAEAAARAEAAGFRVERLTGEELQARYRIEAAPLLVIADAGGKIAYLGGYKARKEAALVEDVAILTSLRQGRERAPLPLFGCALSRRLQAAVDPLALKY